MFDRSARETPKRDFKTLRILGLNLPSNLGCSDLSIFFDDIRKVFIFKACFSSIYFIFKVDSFSFLLFFSFIYSN